MHVGELARHTGASVRSLHYYEQVGLLPTQRQENGYRHYAEEAIEQVRRIRMLLALGFSTEDIRLLAPCFVQSADGVPLCDAGLARYQQKLTEVDAHISMLQELRGRIAQHMQAVQSRETTDPSRQIEEIYRDY